MFRFPPLTPFVRALLIALAASLVLTSVLERFFGIPVVALLAFNPTFVSVATLWQLFTHVLVVSPGSDGAFSIVLSFVFLWWCLAPLEEQYGRAKIGELAVFSALASAVPALAVGFVLPQFSGLLRGPTPITLAAIAAYVEMLPRQARIDLGRSSVDARAILWVNLAFIAIAFFASWNASQLAADLGAIGAGIGFVRYWVHRRPRRRTFDPKRAKQSGRLRLVKNDEDEDPKRWLN